MLKWILPLPCLALIASAWGQVQYPSIEVANLREDVRGLNQRVADLTLRIEQLETELGALKEKSKAPVAGAVTAARLDSAVADLNRTIQSAVAASKSEILQQVAGQMEKLARETNAVLDSASKGPATGTRPAPASPQADKPAVARAATGFSADFPKEGTDYTVQKGDTVELIAKKTGTKARDIINANKLSDPSHILVGQTLFIPGGK